MKNFTFLIIFAFVTGGDCFDDSEEIDCDDELGLKFKCGPVCEVTCDPLAPYCRNVPNNIPCVPDCYCKKGLVLHRAAGRCVPQEKCKSTCPPEMEYKQCGSLVCAPTCRRPNVTLQCQTSAGPCVEGCFCKDGMVLDTLAGACVYLAECTKECPENMKYDTCGPFFPKTCFPMPYNEVYPKECVSGCVCSDGYVLHQSKCIKISDCPRMTCPPEMELKNCIKDCPPTCRYRSPIVNCFEECITGCICKKGLVYDKKLDRCVEVAKCNDLCPENMVYDECASDCPATCGKSKPDKCKSCSKGCRCIDSLVLDVKKEKCVMPQDCEEDCPSCPQWVHGIA